MSSVCHRLSSCGACWRAARTGSFALVAALSAFCAPRAHAEEASAVAPARRTCDFTTGVAIDTSKLQLTDSFDCVSLCIESRNAFCEKQTSNRCAIEHELAADHPEVHCAAHACEPGGLVTRRGEEFQSTAGDDDLLLDLLGPIDSREDALMRVRALGYAPCTEPGDAARFTDGSYEVFGTYTETSGPTTYFYELRFRVHPDGSAERLEPMVRRRRVDSPVIDVFPPRDRPLASAP